MDIGCPWDSLTASSFPICEASLCSWIRQPANTISNAIYFMVGWYLLRRSHTTSLHTDRALGFCALFVGVCSSVAHASVTRLFGFFDFVSILAVCSVMVAINWQRHRGYPAPFAVPAKNFLCIFSLSVILLYLMESHKSMAFSVFVLLLISWEIYLLNRLKNQKHWMSLGKFVGCFAVGGVAISLDSAKVICDPNNHFFQMHSVWHVLTALSIIFIADHIRGLPSSEHNIVDETRST